MTSSRGRRTQRRAAERTVYNVERRRLLEVQKSFRTKKRKTDKKVS